MRALASSLRFLSVTLLLCVGTGCMVVSTLAPQDQYTTRGVTSPVAVSSTIPFTQISAGFFHSCAVDGTGAVWCWGSNDNLRAGSTDTTTRCEIYACVRQPLRLEGTLRFRAVSAGVTHSCGITTSGRVACWGGSYSLSEFLLGVANVSRSAQPVLVASDSLFTQVRVGAAHACGLTVSGAAFCWGLNMLGMLGDGTQTSRSDPVAVTTDKRFVQLALGGNHACGVTATGEMWCWGANRWGQLGVGEVPANNFGVGATRPVKVVGTQRWTAVSAGQEHTCALDDGGKAWCWGQNNALQLGDRTFDSHRGVPVAVQGNLTFVDISAGSVNACGRQASGAVWCWGSNYFGALGNGRMVNGGEPTLVQTRGGPWSTISLGGSHSCGIDMAGRSWCWGDKLYGQLGSR